MRKIQRIYESTQEINFISPQREFSLYWKAFQESELGGIHKAIPWNELVKSLKIRNNSETGKSVPDRIVSISKSYIRPIVRGKEVKTVEFGAKVNMIQFDGINFIEHLSFNAFNEGTRLVKSIRYGRSRFGKITHISADDIYATNANRKYSTAAHIVTNFKRKGRAGKHEEHRRIISREFRKERTVRMEGSFGTEKEHYGLQKIKSQDREE